MSNSNVHFLRLVAKDDERIRPAVDEQTPEKYWQPALFPDFDNVALALDLDASGPSGFMAALEEMRPHFVIDLRIVPRFDYLGLSRRIAFDLFRRNGAMYLDVAGDLGVTDQRDARMNPAFIGDYLRIRLARANKLRGPLTFLIEHEPVENCYVPMLLKYVASDHPWHVVKAAH